MHRNQVFDISLEPELAKLKYPLDLEQVKSAVSDLLKARASKALSS